RADFDQVRLHERDVVAREQQALGQLLGADATVLVEGRAPLRRDALDAGLDGDAAGAAEQRDHLRLPEIEPRLDAEGEVALDEALEQLPPRQEDLVDEVEILHALRLQRVDLCKQRVEISPTIFVAKVDLRAEAAGVGAP